MQRGAVPYASHPGPSSKLDERELYIICHVFGGSRRRADVVEVGDEAGQQPGRGGQIIWAVAASPGPLVRAKSRDTRRG